MNRCGGADGPLPTCILVRPKKGRPDPETRQEDPARCERDDYWRYSTRKENGFRLKPRARYENRSNLRHERRPPPLQLDIDGASAPSSFADGPLPSHRQLPESGGTLARLGGGFHRVGGRRLGL